MSAWSQRSGSVSPVAGVGGAPDFSGASSASSGMGSVYRPTPAGGPSAPAESDERTGVVNINLLDPGSNSLDPISELMNGLRQGTVGRNEGRDEEGFVDPSPVGNIPIIGNIGRGIANVIGGGGEVAGAVLAGVGGAMERIPTGYDSGDAKTSYLQREYEAIPAEFRKQYDDAINKEKGLFGTGLLDDDAHWKSLAIRKWREDQQFKNPSLKPGAFAPANSLSGALASMFDVLDVSAAVAAKGWSQLDTPGQQVNGEWLDRIDTIMAVGDGEIAFNEDKGLAGTGILAGDPTTGLNDMEALVYAKLKNGDWTRDEAADFLASNGQAFGHSAVANVGGSLALDPLNIATFGAGAVAKVGATGAARVARLTAATKKADELRVALEGAEAALKATRGVKASKGVRAVKGAGKREVRLAKKAVEQAREEYNAAQSSVDAFKAYHSGSDIRKINVIARAAEGSTKVSKFFELAGTGYAGLAGTSVGRAAKITRTIIDPFHAIDLKMPGGARVVDIYSDASVRSVVDTLGVNHYKGLLDDALRQDSTRGMFNQLTTDIATAAANMARGGVMTLFRASQEAAQLGEELMKKLPTDDDMFELARTTTKQRDLNRWLRESALKNVQVERWTDEAHKTLAKGLEKAYPEAGRDAAEWLKAFKTMSKEQKSLYKLAVYGRANTALIEYVGRMSDDVASLLPVPKERMVLLARNTLTRVGGEDLLTQLSKIKKSSKKRAALIAEWQERYPQLGYISLDGANLDKSVNDFVQWLGDNIERLPMQMLDEELAKLGDDAEELLGTLGEYKLGFRPEDRFLWGLERESGSGLYRPVGMAWADHVGAGATAYRPAAALRLNIAGHPIPDIKGVRAATKLVDHLDSAARMAKVQVSSAMIVESARKRFVARAVSGDLAGHGVTERVAQDWFERIAEYTREHPGYSGPRGMGGDELYRAIREKGLIPQPLLNGERRLNPDDIMRLVLEAYDGDMRLIGLTQKLSGRAKRYLFETTGSNFAGQLAEHAWPTLKFRYNPIFQLQEKIEPWVLNAQRGVSFATGVTMSDADRATEKLLHRMTDNSLVRQADLDQFEYSSEVLARGMWKKTANTPGTALNKLQQLGQSLTEVQGMKRVNMLRTFRKGLGKDLRSAWDEARPGEWDQMKEFADLKAGKVLSDDDFALQMVAENAFANDVFVTRVAGKAGKYSADWANAIKTGAWHTPTTLGELKALDLDHVAASLRLVNNKGEDIKDLNQLRATLATEPGTMDKVIDGLARLGADKDYIRRVRNGLDFSWGGFWKTAETRFGLTGEESARLQDMMAQAASLRGMTPVEFMSQVFSPSLIDGTEGVLGHLEGQVRLLREARLAGRKVKPLDAKWAETRTQLAGKEGVSTRDDLVRQISKAFAAHLDPSARRALLMEFDPVLRDAVNAGTIKLDLMEVQKLWDDLADNQLADRILGYMDGKQGTHAFDAVTDATRGVEPVRLGANRYMQERGVTPHEERRYYQPDDDLSERTAAAYRDLPEVEYEKSGRRPNIKQVQNSSTELKPRPDGVTERAYLAYQDMVVETRAQWDFMTRDKAKGGMGIKVIIAKGDPYPNSAAMRADVAKGRIRVFAGSSDHPLMTNEQNVMFRAVHDVFGHAAEGFEFGPRGELNAAIKHSQMYSDTSRAAMLTETHGQNSWVNFSDEPFDAATPTVANAPITRVQLDPANPLADFERLHGTRLFDENATSAMQPGVFPPLAPGEEPKNLIHFYGKDASGTKYELAYGYTDRVGAGIKGLPPEQQAIVLQPLSDLLQEFPGLQVYHFDMVSFSEPLLTDAKGALTGMGFESAGGLTWGGGENPVIILNQDSLWQTGKGFTKDGDIAANQTWAGSRNQETAFDYFSKQWIAKRSSIGAPGTARPYTIGYVVRHESGHAFDTMRRPKKYNAATNSWDITTIAPGHEAYGEMMRRFEALGANLDLSEYGMSNTQEFAAELFAFATDPRYDADLIHEPALRDMAEEFRHYLYDSGEWKPTTPPTPLTEAPRPMPIPGPSQDLNALAKQKLQVTDNIEGAHFMTPDGTLVRGVGEHWEAAAKLGGEERVRAAGFVRISGSGKDHLNFDISGPLTSAQKQAMLDAASTRQTVTIDLHEGRWFGDGSDYVSNYPGMGDFDSAAWSNKRVINTAAEKIKAIDAERKATFGPDRAPAGGTPPVEPPMPKTVREANKAKPGSVYAKQKGDLLPQDILDEFGAKFVGKGKHVESNPDVARTAQMFGKWTEAVVANGLLKGEHSVYGGLLSDIAGLPTTGAVPYNFTEGAVANLAYQSMVRKWDDAFRLQYFAQERSMLERSINHPMFGLYPASYMWGKIMPEMVRFIAAEPFGNKTGGLLYSAMDVQASIALRREYDPYFDENMEKLGHSQAMSFGGYLLPGLPWDLGAAAPSWMTSIADQGTAELKRVEAGQEPEGISLTDPVTSTFKKLAPLTTTAPWAGRAIEELNGQTEEEVAEDERDTDRFVQAAELQPTMERIMKELQEALR